MKNMLLGLVTLTTLMASAQATECSVERYSGNFYVKIGSEYMTGAISSVDGAMDALKEMYSYRMCSLPTPKERCNIERYSGNYYVKIGSEYMSGAMSSIESATRYQSQLMNYNLCFAPNPRKECEIERYSGNFYVKKGSDYYSGAISSIPAAFEHMSKLVSAGVCLAQGGTYGGPRPVPSTPVRNDYRDRLGFDFKIRALMIADTVVSVSKAVEGYITNDQERKIDEIKKQAIRLRSRINGGSDLKLVRNTLFHLHALLQDAAYFIDSILETDRLDHIAESYLTAYESIPVMVDFLDRDFTGRASELY